MTDSDGELSAPWRTALEELELESRPVDAPDDPEREGLSWFELYSKFATRGFVRAAVGEADESGGAVRVGFAVPAGGSGRELLGAVREEFAEVVGGEWRIVAEKPDWELGGLLDSTPATETARTCIKRLTDLGTVAESGSVGEVDWLADRLGRSTADASAGGRTAQSKTAGAEATGANAFESIGDGSNSSSAALHSVGIERWELLEVDGAVEARIWLDAPIPPNDADDIGRELTHALRSRYDIAARPLPVDDGEATGTELKLEANPASSGVDGPTSPDVVRNDLESYLERLVRFDELGVKLASVLGVGDEPSTDRESGPSPEKRGRGRREDSNMNRSSSETTKRESGGRGDQSSSDDARRSDSSPERHSAAPSRESSKRRSPSDESRPSSEPDDEPVVLDIGDDEPDPPEPTTAPHPGSGLQPGNYRDPRLMRENATTSLVDIVLRHPGYAEEKMGHNLSILLDIDFPDAMELVQQAPSVIAWGVGRERAVDFEDFIENAGGKVVLVEPDSLKD